MKNKLVSIISPVFNGEKYVDNYLESVLHQTYPKIELIMINDGSQDKTDAILQSYKEKFVNRGYSFIISTLDKNSGQAAAINLGLKIFSGEYIMWMDSDDILLPEAIEKKVDFLENNLECDFVLNEGEIVREENLNNRIGILKRNKPIGEDNLFKDLICEHNVVFGAGTILVKSVSLKKAIPNLSIFESREGQNWQLMLPLAYNCKYGYLEEVLFKYVVHNDSHSHISRTYRQEIERRKNFYLLQENTIDNIVNMSNEEKIMWKELAYKKMLYVQYCLANKYHHIRDSRHYKKKIEEYKLTIIPKDRFLVVDILNMYSKIKSVLKKCFNVIFNFI